MTDPHDELLATYETELYRIAELAGSLRDDEWGLPTECPGWSVKDVVAHVTGYEAALHGRPGPDHTLPADLPHVRNDAGRFMELHVDVRRPVSGPAVVAELVELLPERMADLRALVAGGASELPSPFGGTWPLAAALQTRVFDAWVHEQDIRRATGRPGGLDGPAAEISRDRIAGALPRVVARAGAGPGTSVSFRVEGPTALLATVAVGDDGRGALAPRVDEGATARLALGWETFARLACGRIAPEHAHVAIGGDDALARRVLAGLVVTP